jgi:hypothetical protein
MVTPALPCLALPRLSSRAEFGATARALQKLQSSIYRDSWHGGECSFRLATRLRSLRWAFRRETPMRTRDMSRGIAARIPTRVLRFLIFGQPDAIETIMGSTHALRYRECKEDCSIARNCVVRAAAHVHQGQLCGDADARRNVRFKRCEPNSSW